MRETFYLEFESREGTDRQLFATFRLHLSWAKRLRKGRVVLLADTKTRTVFGKARVIDLAAGKCMAVLRDWAHLSHLEDGHGERPDDLAVNRRYASLRARYGPHKFDQTSNITAIILRRTA